VKIKEAEKTWRNRGGQENGGFTVASWGEIVKNTGPNQKMSSSNKSIGGENRRGIQNTWQKKTVGGKREEQLPSLPPNRGGNQKSSQKKKGSKEENYIYNHKGWHGPGVGGRNRPWGDLSKHEVLRN